MFNSNWAWVNILAGMRFTRTYNIKNSTLQEKKELFSMYCMGGEL